MDDLFSVYTNIISEKVRDRVDGIQALRSLLSSPRVERLDDKSFHKLFEGIFQNVMIEKRLYIKSPGRNLQIAERLSSAAQVLRLAVEKGGTVLRYKTINALIQHIVSLAYINGELFEPIGTIYMRTIRYICSYAPHIEHFSNEEWSNLAEFNALIIQRHAALVANDTSVRPGQDIYEAIECLSLLLDSPRHQLITKSEQSPKGKRLFKTGLYEALLSYLRVYSYETRGHFGVLFCINKLLTAAIVNSLLLYHSMFEDLPLVISSLWSTKSASLKDQLIVTTFCLLPAIQESSKDWDLENIDSNTSRIRISNLINLIFEDYKSRISRELLLLEDISLKPPDESALPFLYTRTFQLSEERGLSCWLILVILANCNMLLKHSTEDFNTASIFVKGRSIKRRRLIESSTTLSGDDSLESLKAPSSIISQIREPSNSDTLGLLQILAFEWSLGLCSKISTDEFLIICQCARSDEPMLCSWAMVVLASIAQFCKETPQDRMEHWDSLLELSMRKLSTQETCATSFHLINSILRANILPSRRLSVVVKAILISMETFGPASISDSSLFFFQTVLKKRNELLNSDNSDKVVERMLKWIFGRLQVAIQSRLRWKFDNGLKQMDIFILINFLLRCVGRSHLSERQSLPLHVFNSLTTVQFIVQLGVNSELIDVLFSRSKPKNISNELSESFTLSVSKNMENLIINLLNSFVQQFVFIQDDRSDVEDLNLSMIFCIQMSTFLLLELSQYSPEVARSSSFSEQSPIIRLLQIIDNEAKAGKLDKVFLDGLACTFNFLEDSVTLIQSRFLLESFENLCSTLEMIEEMTGKGLADKSVSREYGGTDFERVTLSRSSALRNFNADRFPRSWNLRSISSCTVKYQRIVRFHIALIAASSPKFDQTSNMVRYIGSVSSVVLNTVLPAIYDRLLNSVAVDHIDIDLLVGILAVVGKRNLGKHQFERCEITMTFCACLLARTFNLWFIKPTNQNELFIRIFDWLRMIVLDNNISSAVTRLHVLDIIFKIAIHKTETRECLTFLDSNESKIALESIFDADIFVQMAVSNQFPTLLNLFPTSTHLSIFQILMGSFQVHFENSNEGVEAESSIMFVYTMCQLIGRSHSVSREAILELVHFFPLATLPIIKNALVYNVSLAAKLMNVQSPQTIFDAFCSQIIYGLPSFQSFVQFKFEVFGFQSFEELLEISIHELISQIMVGGSDPIAIVKFFSSLLHESTKEVLIKSFPKVIAYIITSFRFKHGSRSNPSVSSALKLFQDILGFDEFVKLATATAPSAKVFLLDMIDIQSLNSAHLLSIGLPEIPKRWNDINEYSIFMPTSLPEPNQPYFQPCVIIDALTTLTRSYWSDQSYIVPPCSPLSEAVYIVRALLGRLPKSVNAFQKCAVLKKLKLQLVLIKSYNSPYLAKLCIHTITPLMLETTCLPDTLDIITFFFSSNSLKNSPQLLMRCIITVSYHVQLLLDSSGNVPKTEIHKMLSRFATFLSNIITIYGKSNGSINEVSTWLQKLIYFGSLNNPGCRDWNSQDIKIILLSGDLDFISRRDALLIFSLDLNKVRNLNNFSPFPTAELLSEEECYLAMKPLLQSCRDYQLSEVFFEWVATVAARAYMFNGLVVLDSSDDSLEVFKSNLKSSEDCFLNSALSIVFVMIRYLDSTSFSEAELSEMAVRRSLRLFPKKFEVDLSQYISNEILDALDFTLPDIPIISRSSSILKLQISRSSIWASRIVDLFCVSLKYQFSDFFGIVQVLARDLPAFAEDVFPFLLCSLIYTKSVSKQVSNVFKNVLVSDKAESAAQKALIIKSFIHLQTQLDRDPEDQMNPIVQIPNVDLFDLLCGALSCKLFPTALWICEIIWSKGVAPQDLSDFLVAIYNGLEDPDGLFGVSINPSIQSAIQFAELGHDRWKSMSYRNALMDNSRSLDSHVSEQNLSGIAEAFAHIGLNGLSLRLLNGEISIDNAAAYDIAWKLSKWDLPYISDASSNSAINYMALWNLNPCRSISHNSLSINEFTARSRISIMQSVLDRSVSGRNRFQSSLQTLSILKDIQTISECSDSASILEQSKLLYSSMNWVLENRFEFSENILIARKVAFEELSRRETSDEYMRKSFQIGSAISLKRAIEVALVHKEFQKVLSLSLQFSQLAEPSDSLFEESLNRCRVLGIAQVLWHRGDQDIAINMVKGIVQQEYKPDPALDGLNIPSSIFFSLLGKWVAEARQERPDNILSKYLESAVASVENTDENGNHRSEVYHTYANFCDSQLRSSDNVEEVQRLERLRSNKLHEIEQLEKLSVTANSSDKRVIRQHLNKVQRMFDSDDSEYQRQLESRARFLTESIRFYLRSVQWSDRFDEDSYRFCSIWLANSTNDQVNEVVSAEIKSTPMAKLVGLINQLSSRLLIDKKSQFQNILWELLVQLCRDHPYHCLYQIFALKSNEKSKRHDPSLAMRARAATRLWQELKAATVYNQIYLDSVDQFAGKCVRIAATEFKSSRGLSTDLFPDRLWWQTTLPLIKIPPPTMNIQVRKDCDYRGIPKISSILHKVALASGLSRPKICDFIVDDGTTCRMLIKGGNDDLRQDSVMEQVFDQVNYFLKKKESTEQHRMHIRTYKVIPLTETTGIIEFVRHTISLQDAVQPLHEFYYPDDWKGSVCRSHIKECQRSSTEERITMYREVETHVHPVLRYFFLERFRNPEGWMKSKIAYTRGTAAVSMVGHMLGLGDRHCNNILLDTLIGEPIHIDLGVAFDQGQVLQIPETVPFRLTRDVVDGMGTTGVEGIFRRSCCVVLDVLRQERENIMTILDVLRYDPLYSWTISPLRKKRLQEDTNLSGIQLRQKEGTKGSTSGLIPTRTAGTSVITSEGTNASEAARALEIVKQKLSKTLSVEAVVNQLINDAVDPRNLALIYCGWSAFY
ncbi:uncharacterized protein V1516DRAFT_667928 [Lipomyces oligophaga]|uniref:uncharacterized protein n=1 Tax=Lipomyces oligophaga TaxID=45792 RepID=UPI0034CE30DF